jgi:hypothetical protein
MVETRGQQTILLKGQMVNMLGFYTITQLYHYNAKALMANM